MLLSGPGKGRDHNLSVALLLTSVECKDRLVLVVLHAHNADCDAPRSLDAHESNVSPRGVRENIAEAEARFILRDSATVSSLAKLMAGSMQSGGCGRSANLHQLILLRLLLCNCCVQEHYRAPGLRAEHHVGFLLEQVGSHLGLTCLKTQQPEAIRGGRCESCGASQR